MILMGKMESLSPVGRVLCTAASSPLGLAQRFQKHLPVPVFLTPRIFPGSLSPAHLHLLCGQTFPSNPPGTSTLRAKSPSSPRPVSTWLQQPGQSPDPPSRVGGRMTMNVSHSTLQEAPSCPQTRSPSVASGLVRLLPREPHQVAIYQG